MTSNYASAADILSARSRRFKDATVLGMKVRLRSITAGEYAQVERRLTESASKAKGTSDAKRAAALAGGYALLIKLCVCDGNGEPLFTDDQVAQLQTVDARVSQALVNDCMEHCGLSGADLEDLAKNSAETAGDGSPSVSPTVSE
jgi:hypothetical protein